MIERKDFGRLSIFGALVAVIVLLILWKYLSVMVLNRQPDAGNAVPTTVERGPILDRNGRILAVETRQYSVTAWVPSLANRQDEATLLSGILGMTKDEILQAFTSHAGFLYLKRKVSQGQSQQVRALIDQDRLPGIGLEPDYGRIYPEGDIASHVIGYVGTDNQGLDGVEYSFNNQLSPPAPPGSAGRDLFGNQVFLTIDLNIQYLAQELAQKVYEDSKADKLMLLVMQAHTGDLLAYVSYPEFDPNNFTQFSANVRRNDPISYIYEPGSTIKIFTISSFLQLGGITPQTEFFDNGVYEHRLPSGDTIRIKGLAPHEWEDAQLIIKYSSNVGAAYASDTVSDSAFYQMLRAFGFGGSTFISLPGEATGILRPIDQWTPRSKPTISFGQEIGVTAMQMMEAATVLTNDGVMLKPHIVSKVVAPDGRVIQSFPREPIRQVLSPTVVHDMLQYMETGTESDGYAREAKIPGVRTSAKTGTAQVYDPATGKYSENAYVLSTIAIFPTDNPQLIVYAVVVNAKAGPLFGAFVASPLVRAVGERLVSYLGIPKENDRVITSPAHTTIQQRQPLTVSASVPDLTGLSKRELLPLFQDPDIRVRIIGDGWVFRQDPAPGTPVTKGMTVTVELR